jgi:ribosomal protein S18 acetylase RimI-like enzyme
MPLIRPFGSSDWPRLWPLLQATIASGDAYAFDPQSSETDIHLAWIEAPTATFVACGDGGRIVGSYFIKPNQPGLGSHVCNCGYVTAAAARGQGIATALCEHSQVQARAMGIRAMQFNLVVATNEQAVRLWLKLGFAVVGRLPGAFAHRALGDVDALVMFKSLTANPAPA